MREDMNGLRINRRHFVIGGTLAAVSLGAQAAQPKPVNPPINPKNFASWVPDNFGPWTFEVASGVVLPPPDILAARLYDNMVVKAYTRPGVGTVTALMAYNYRQDGILQIHRPEVCYPTGGFTLSQTRQFDLETNTNRKIPANFFTASADERIEQVLYWTRIGSRFPQTWLQQRLAVMESNLHGEIPDGVLMRFSVNDADASRSLDVMRDFVNGFLAASKAPLHHVLLGDA